MGVYDDFPPHEGAAPDHDVLEEVSLECRVILFNDEWHTFDEVIEQIIIATHCSYEHAERCTLEVHHQGKALVYHGELTACLRVSAILEEIALHTQVEM
jgi:ATP-dependent Clp protease adaptor protein ClpS